MREIKFRAWDTVEKKMKLPTLLRLSRNLPYTDDNNNGKVFQMQCNGQENIEYFNGRIELMQYTGLKDKNGKEIYEGDIVRLWESVGAIGDLRREYAYPLPVEYCELWAQFVVADRQNKLQFGIWQNFGAVEVIGNIYDNPELLVKT